jgi:hypothetical protein
MSKCADGPHGHPIGYKRGCPKCDAAQSKKSKTPAARRARADARQRQLATRARRLVGTKSEGGNVVALPTRPQTPHPAAPFKIGENEAAVIEQCANSKLADTKPSIVAQCRALARILDTNELMTIWPRTSSQLQALLKDLDGPKKKTAGGRLAQVSAMAGRRAQ